MALCLAVSEKCLQLRAPVNIGPIMRAAIPLPIPERLVRDARLYSARGHDLDAVCYVLEDYGRLVAELRQLRRRVAELDQEGAELDSLMARRPFASAIRSKARAWKPIFSSVPRWLSAATSIRRFLTVMRPSSCAISRYRVKPSPRPSMCPSPSLALAPSLGTCGNRAVLIIYIMLNMIFIDGASCGRLAQIPGTPQRH